MRLRDGTYQADSSRPSAVSIATSWWGMPSEDSWIAQRGACVTRRTIVNGITTNRAKTGTAASQPAPWASRQPSARAPRRPPWGGDRGQARSDEEEAAGDHAHAGDVGPVRSGVHDVQAVGDDAEAEAQEADDDAQDDPRRPRHVRAGQRPRDRDGDDRQQPEERGVGSGEREIEQVERDEGEAGEQERALEPGEARAEPAVPRGHRGAGAGVGERGGHLRKPRADGPARTWETAGVRAPARSRTRVRAAVPSQPEREASGLTS